MNVSDRMRKPFLKISQTDGENGYGSRQDPLFHVIVPSVDIDWAGREDEDFKSRRKEKR